MYVPLVYPGLMSKANCSTIFLSEHDFCALNTFFEKQSHGTKYDCSNSYGTKYASLNKKIYTCDFILTHLKNKI